MIGGYPLEREGSPSVAGREASAPLPTLRCPFRTPLSVPQPSGETINHTWRDHYYRGHDSYLAVLLPTPSTRSPAEILDSACGYRGLWPHQRDVQWAAQARFPV